MNREPENELMDGVAEAEAYASADFSTPHDAFVDRLIELSGGFDHAMVADLGAGPCDIAIRLWRRRPNWRIVAVDGSAAMLHLARIAIDDVGAANSIELIEADALGGALADGAFGIVYSNSLLHHIRDAVALWRRMAKLAKPGGLIFARDLCRRSDRGEAMRLLDLYAAAEPDVLRSEFFNSLLAAYTVDEVKTQLITAGLGHFAAVAIGDRHLDAWGHTGV